MLLIVLIRGVMLPGAMDGIYSYLSPDLNRLSNIEVFFFVYIQSELLATFMTILWKCCRSGSMQDLGYVSPTAGTPGLWPSWAAITNTTTTVISECWNQSWSYYNGNEFLTFHVLQGPFLFLLCLLKSGTSFVAGFVVLRRTRCWRRRRGRIG